MHNIFHYLAQFINSITSVNALCITVSILRVLFLVYILWDMKLFYYNISYRVLKYVFKPINNELRGSVPFNMRHIAGPIMKT